VFRRRRSSRAADRPLISAALIVRDEEHHLPDCLASIEGVADEVVVVDTGSADRTVELATAAGAIVHHEPWKDDFAHARNTALDHCSGVWILYIDADERVRPVSRLQLESELARPGMVGAEVTFHASPGLTAYPELRLFRNDPRIRFEGIIHETIWPGVLSVVARDGGGVGRCSLTFDHVGYEGSQEHKYDRDLPLLLKALETNPDHVFCWFHLGYTYMGLGRREDARAAWRSGMDAARRTGARRPADALPAIVLAADLHDQGADASDVVDQGLSLFPDDPTLRWFSARLLMVDSHWNEAIAEFTKLQKEYAQGKLPDGVGFPENQFTSRTDSQIGTCQHQLGRYREAASTFERAAEVDPENLEYRAKAQLNRHLAETP